MESRGFQPSKVDPSVYLRDDCICLTFVDDFLIFSKDPKIIDELIASLQKDFSLTDEGDIDKYLGIKVETNSKGETKLSQPHLIDRIITAVPGMSEANIADVHAIKDAVLHKDQGGAPRKQDWHYHSVIGMLNFLCNSTRPDISYAVHQCARFSENSKSSHEKAVK